MSLSCVTTGFPGIPGMAGSAGIEFYSYPTPQPAFPAHLYPPSFSLPSSLFLPHPHHYITHLSSSPTFPRHSYFLNHPSTFHLHPTMSTSTSTNTPLSPGQGNIGPDSTAYVDGEIHHQADPTASGAAYSAGRGGAGNISNNGNGGGNGGATATATGTGTDGDVIPSEAVVPAREEEEVVHTGVRNSSIPEARPHTWGTAWRELDRMGYFHWGGW
jgi:hypothetical protein